MKRDTRFWVGLGIIILTAVLLFFLIYESIGNAG